jgi:hypothetical protein
MSQSDLEIFNSLSNLIKLQEEGVIDENYRATCTDHKVVCATCRVAFGGFAENHAYGCASMAEGRYIRTRFGSDYHGRVFVLPPRGDEEVKDGIICDLCIEDLHEKYTTSDDPH